MAAIERKRKKNFIVLALWVICSMFFTIELTMAKPNQELKADQVLNRSETDYRAFENRLETVRQVLKIPGMSAAIVRDQELVWSSGFGYANLENLTPATPDTIYGLASVTKPVATGTSVMLLIEQGKLRLLDRVKDFIPTFMPWKSDSSSGIEHIRLIHLLTHTSGLPPYAPVEELKEKYGSPAPDSLIQHIATVERHHAPGTHFKYS